MQGIVTWLHAFANKCHPESNIFVQKTPVYTVLLRDIDLVLFTGQYQQNTAPYINAVLGLAQCESLTHTNIFRWFYVHFVTSRFWSLGNLFLTVFSNYILG